MARTAGLGLGRGRGRGRAAPRRAPVFRTRAPVLLDDESLPPPSDDGEPVAPVVLGTAATDLSLEMLLLLCGAAAAITCMPQVPFLLSPAGLALAGVVDRRDRRSNRALLRQRRRARRERWHRLASREENPVRPPNRGHGIYDDFVVLFDPPDDDEDVDYLIASMKEKFRSHFRLSFEAYQTVMQTIRPLLRSRAPKQLRDRSNDFLHFRNGDEVALIALWQLATGATYRGTAQVFRRNLSGSVVMRCVRAFTSAVVSELTARYVNRHWPNSEAKRAAAARAFKAWSGFDDVLGVLDGSHIGVEPSADIHDDFFNRKGWYSIILSGLVDAVGRFIHVHVGLPGQGSDVQALQDSALWTHGPQSASRVRARSLTKPFEVGMSRTRTSSWATARTRSRAGCRRAFRSRRPSRSPGGERTTRGSRRRASSSNAHTASSKASGDASAWACASDLPKNGTP